MARDAEILQNPHLGGRDPPSRDPKTTPPGTPRDTPRALSGHSPGTPRDTGHSPGTLGPLPGQAKSQKGYLKLSKKRRVIPPARRQENV